MKYRYAINVIMNHFLGRGIFYVVEGGGKDEHVGDFLKVGGSMKVKINWMPESKMHTKNPCSGLPRQICQ